MKRSDLNRYIKEARFGELFITELGWNNPKSPVALPPVVIDEVEYSAHVVAERSNFRILVCEVDVVPVNSVCKRIDLKIRNYANDYILIFVQRKGFHHRWLAPVHRVEKRDIVTTEYTTTDQAEFLFQKVDNLAFGYDEVTTIVDVRKRVQDSFAVNAEKITKDFYAGFKKEHKAFVEFITGIEGTDTVERDRQWYASVMLNRLMFCYFIQKKGFLDGNVNYLRNKLDMVQRERGENRFFRSFYLGFLKNLFHDGLNSPKHDAKFVNVYGRIPYLNGGMFDEHQIEHDYAGMDIADEAFERLFKFFDKWEWHLDTRISASGKDINPDVLGYIFEQYINDRAQMGAYYTKEDITEYIGRNCILPYLFDQVKSATDESVKEFARDGYVWCTLRESGDRYIFDAVKKGHDVFDKIPASIARGIITDSMRKEYSETPIKDLPDTHIPLAELRSEWNSRTPEKWGLPNEIWRESIDRIQRCDDILNKIKNGEITSINDFITYNLDIRSFAYDLIAKGDNRFVGWFYHALQKVTILDPTCGSGAFLFAAMNILEPLYEICIDRMQEFNAKNPKLFKTELAEITDKYRSNIQYFIFKSIILRNLYGVDIMVEATEIAKLRLFLKMVAVVEVDRRADNIGLDPLPDIDFNIRCGNTLVGYANKAQLDRDLNDGQGSLAVGEANKMLKGCIEEEMRKVATAYGLFKEVQLKQEEDMAAFKQAKHDLRERLKELNDKLNQRLYLGTYGMNVEAGENFTQSVQYKEWLKSHQPFHWLAEFYQIIEGNQGFDVIIGNPPYVEYTRKNKGTGVCVRDIYKLNGYDTIKCGNLYAFVIERSCVISKSRDNLGFIVPLSLASNNNMSDLRDYICKKGSSWYSHYEVRPAKLFEGAEQRLTIFIIRNTENKTLYSTAIQRWNNEHRDILFHLLAYAPSFNNGSIWRTSSNIEISIYSKFNTQKTSAYQVKSIGCELHYRTAGVRYWIIFLNNGFGTESLSNKVAFFEDEKIARYYMAAFNSNIFWWYYALNFDMFNLKDYMIFNFKLDFVPDMGVEDMASVLEIDMEKNKVYQEINSKTRGIVTTSYYQKKLSKQIVDSIDCKLALIYGFTDEELDFIINYDIKYRMGDELNGGE